PGGPTRGSDRRHRRRGTRRAARTRQTQTGPSVASPHGVHLAVHTENHADGPTTWWTLLLPPSPTTSRDAPAQVAAYLNASDGPAGPPLGAAGTLPGPRREVVSTLTDLLLRPS